jgi:carboxyl-terminal processing protease
MDAGLLAEDHIIRINDNDITTDDEIQVLTSRIQGPIGTSVTLTIQRGNQQFTKTIIRKKITIDPIQVTKLSSDTILMSISSFQI